MRLPLDVYKCKYVLAAVGAAAAGGAAAGGAAGAAGGGGVVAIVMCHKYNVISKLYRLHV